jgi:ubiquinone biosynthesis monooxygenase Coq7
MRINHAGEICAQGLYQGQALTARLPKVREKMEQAAEEENDHIAWTADRIKELGGHTSNLNPFWYAGSFALGAFAGLAGDRWSLGFVAETEKQVVAHLTGHLDRIATEDGKSRAILVQMREDEGKHATTAITAGAASFPRPIPRLMKFTSNIFTNTTYWV